MSIASARTRSTRCTPKRRPACRLAVTLHGELTMTQPNCSSARNGPGRRCAPLSSKRTASRPVPGRRSPRRKPGSASHSDRGRRSFTTASILPRCKRPLRTSIRGPTCSRSAGTFRKKASTSCCAPMPVRSRTRPSTTICSWRATARSRPALETLAAGLGLGARVHFTGRVDHGPGARAFPRVFLFRAAIAARAVRHRQSGSDGGGQSRPGLTGRRRTGSG